MEYAGGRVSAFGERGVYQKTAGCGKMFTAAESAANEIR